MDDARTTEWIRRSTSFLFIARGLACPDKDLCEAVADGSFSLELAEMLAGEPAFAAQARELSLAIEALVGQMAPLEFLSALRREYTRLFTAPEGAAIPLWEALFLDPDRSRCDFGAVLVRTGEAVDARRRYEDAGVRLSSRDSADHMGIECEFAGYLCRRIAEAESSVERTVWQERFDAFAASHLDRWFAAFFDTLASSARHPFYRALALLGRAMGGVASGA